MNQYLRVSLLTYISVDSGLVGVHYNNGYSDNVLATAVAIKVFALLFISFCNSHVFIC